MAEIYEPTILEVAVAVKTSMPEMDHRILERKVVRDSKRIINQYASLRANTQQYLCDIQCEVSKLLVTIMDVQHVKCLSEKSPLHELNTAASIDIVFLVLVQKNLISFLQFSIIQQIITTLCRKSEELQEQLKAYERNFNQYIQKRVCETSLYRGGTFKEFIPRESKDKVPLLLVTDANWNQNVKYVRILELEEFLADILDFDHFNLQILKIEEHCLRILYAVSAHIANSVFPLTREEWSKLLTHGIVEIECLEFHYTLENKGTC